MNSFITDHYFHIGHMHLNAGKACQDYALSDSFESSALAIISDGCSSGANTDIGSRILALATASAIRDSKLSIDLLSAEVSLIQTKTLSASMNLLDLNYSDLLATCSYAYASNIGAFVHLQGDGVVALKYRDGRILFFCFEWKNNMPYYPSYRLNALDDFILAHSNDLEAVSLSEEAYLRDENLEYIKLETKHYSVEEGIDGILINISQEELQSELEYIAVFSDGINQIQGLDWKEAVVKSLAFKTLRGKFLRRRMMCFFRNLSKNDQKAMDDISVAVIHIVPEGKENV